MRKLIVIVAGLTLIATAADARHRRHRGHYLERPNIERLNIERGSIERGSIDRRGPEQSSSARALFTALIPREWRREPPDPNRQGNRFVSPSGDSWLVFYSTPADQEPIEQHWKTVAFVEGEDLTYLQREPNWVAVAGFKGERSFYRKAMLACSGRQWRHIAFEYPAQAKRDFEPLVTRMGRALDRAIDDDCDVTVGGQ